MSIVTTTTTTAHADGRVRMETVTVSTPDTAAAVVPAAEHTDSGMRVPYEIKDSAIGGQGLFATTNIKKGTMLWEYTDESVEKFDEAGARAKLATLDGQELKDFCEHVYCCENKVINIKGDGRMWNHSKTIHNTGNCPTTGENTCTYAVRDIAAGEEFLDNYTTYQALPWFEELCKERDFVSCVAVGVMYD